MNNTEGRAVQRLAWAVMSLNTESSRSEVIRVTDHEDADKAVLENPELFYKSGPFVVT